MEFAFTFPGGTVNYYMNSSLDQLKDLAPPASSILITDQHVMEAHDDRLKDYRCIVVPAGESSKCWQTIQELAAKLIGHEAHRHTMLVGVGGGMITDLTGFLAATYMRGVSAGFVPTTLLAMVDAAIGGKNGINLELHKNMLGTIRQPQFILYDLSFLQTLPDEEWSNGFAEIIKYGCIADNRILHTLQDCEIPYFQRHHDQLSSLILGAVDVKNKIVHADEQETGVRRLLNFGHTAGHAFETLYQLPHGQAVGLGMVVASLLSEELCGLDPAATAQLIAVLKRYKLPVSLSFEAKRVMEVLRMDKKRNSSDISYVLLDKLGKACVKPVSFSQIEAALNRFATAGRE